MTFQPDELRGRAYRAAERLTQEYHHKGALFPTPKVTVDAIFALPEMRALLALPARIEAEAERQEKYGNRFLQILTRNTTPFEVARTLRNLLKSLEPKRSPSPA